MEYFRCLQFNHNLARVRVVPSMYLSSTVKIKKLFLRDSLGVPKSRASFRPSLGAILILNVDAALGVIRRRRAGRSDQF